MARQSAQRKSDESQIPVRAIARTKNHLGVHQVYDPIRCPQAALILCKEHGFNNTQLAKVFGVNPSIITHWLNKYPEFSRAVQEGMDHFNSEVVEKTLLQTALGFEFEEKTINRGYDKHGNPVESETISTRKALPNVKAMTFYLTNRRKDRWKQESSVNTVVSGSVEKIDRSLKITADLSKMDINQLKALREMIASQSVSEQVESHEEHIQPLLDMATTIVDADFSEIGAE